MSVPVFVPYVPASGGGSRARASRILVGTLRRAGATSEPASAPLAPRNRAEDAQLARLIHLGAVKAGRNGYWLDEERYRDIRHARMRMVAILLLLEAAFIATVILYAPHHHH